ncbi:MAG: antitoxin Xre-like helix-turn-helix domain-containing protein [Trueperaceae bacterium]
MFHSGIFDQALSDTGRYFDLDIRDLREAQEAIERGLPFNGFEQLRNILGAGSGELAAALGIAGTTLARRRKEGQLSPEESERLLRLARLVEMARVVLSPNGLSSWFNREHPALAAKPLDCARNEIAARRLETLLGRLADGGPA